MYNSDFKNQIYEKYKYFGYSIHFEGVYKFLGLLNIILLGISAVLSAKFFEPYFISIFGEFSIYAGFVISSMLAISIGFATSKFLVYWHYNRVFEPVLGGLLLGLICLNVFADFSGGQNYAYNIVGEKPTDSKTSEISGIYTPKIEKINAEIADIESKNFYWCKQFGHSSKCGEKYFYIDPIQDKEAVAEIKALKKQRSILQSDMSSQLNSASQNYQDTLNDWGLKINSNRSRFKFGALVCTILFMASSYWRLKYGVRFVDENSENNSETVTVKEKSSTVSNETELFWQKELERNPDLLEEFLSMREKEQSEKKKTPLD